MRVCPELDHLVPVFDNMGPDAVSEDETDTEATRTMGSRVYNITNPFWRTTSEKFETLKTTVDLLALSRKFNNDFSPRQGNWARIRIPGDRPPQYPTTVPKGLPENFYDDGFLADLETRPEELDELDVQPPVDISVPENVLECDLFLIEISRPGLTPDDQIRCALSQLYGA